MENYLINTQAGSEKEDLCFDYWFHDDLGHKDFAYKLYFSRYRYINIEIDYYQCTVLWRRVSEINTIEISDTPFETMSIQSVGENSAPIFELNRLKYYRFFVHGMAYVEVAAKDFSIQQVDIGQLWSGRND